MEMQKLIHEEKLYSRCFRMNFRDKRERLIFWGAGQTAGTIRELKQGDITILNIHPLRTTIFCPSRILRQSVIAKFQRFILLGVRT